MKKTKHRKLRHFIISAYLESVCSSTTKKAGKKGNKRLKNVSGAKRKQLETGSI